jgi:hypothetical protein
MTCHPTDPHNPVPAGAAPAPETATTLECCGALILQQREFMMAQDFVKEADAEGKRDGVKRYCRARPKGLTREGLLALMNRSIFSGGPFGKPMTKPDLRQAVSHPDLPWEEPK